MAKKKKEEKEMTEEMMEKQKMVSFTFRAEEDTLTKFKSFCVVLGLQPVKVMPQLIEEWLAANQAPFAAAVGKLTQ